MTLNSWVRKPILNGLLVFLVSFFSSYSAFGALLKIIHTNDLHSHFEKSQNPGKGGYAALKATINRLKMDADSKMIETLVVDAGDFSEGTPFFLADRGEQSWKAMDEIGYDVVTIGNHDYLMGQADLNRIIKNVNPQFLFLGSNFYPDKKHKELNALMQRNWQVERNGDWIGLMGLTTDSFVYRWRVGLDTIKNPIDVARKMVPELRKKNKYVIAINHIGLSADRDLVKAVPGIDLVVGGHSHTMLGSPYFEKNPSGQYVPIVQAGEHAEYVGDLLVDLAPGRPAKVVSYRLVPVMTDGERDNQVATFVENARKRMESMYPKNWFSEVVGYANEPLLKPSGGKRTLGGDFALEAMKTAAKADVALEAAGELFGDNLPAGPITREDLFKFYPRVFSFPKQPQQLALGWTVWTVDVEGWMLKLAIKESYNRGYPLVGAGLSFTVSGSKGNEKISNLKINGKGYKRFSSYRVALPEGVGRAIAELPGWWKLIQILLQNPSNSNFPMWIALEAELKRRGRVLGVAGQNGLASTMP